MRGSEKITGESILIYGNIGIWESKDDFQTFSDFNQGFPKGIDNRKIYSVKKFGNQIFAGTQLGLYKKATEASPWEKVVLPVRENRIADLSLKKDTLLVLTRNFLLKSTNGIDFKTFQLPAPVDYGRKTGLFETFWQLHSGELWGLPGKLIVDLLGIVTILLAVTGLLHFFFPKIIKKRKSKSKDVASFVLVKKKNLHWHNVIGYIFALFLFINTFSGMHLRPPLLNAIATKKVGIIPGTHLDNPNPWFDKLRRVIWDEYSNQYIFSTAAGFFFADETLTKTMKPALSQPPVSVMGCNVLKLVDEGILLVGSFSGMYIWNFENGAIADFFTGQPYQKTKGIQSPIGENMAAGLVEGKNSAYWFDYNQGAIALSGTKFPEMSNEITHASPMPLWNVALEIHTGRIFENILGPIYILYVPLAGICILLMLISGFLLWWKVFRNKK